MKQGLWNTAALAVALMVASAAPAAGAAGNGPPAAMVALEKSLDKKTGDIAILPARATLHLGDRYYFLSADEAKKVLVDIWGNAPDAVSDVLGMVLPADRTVLDNVWGAVVTYDAGGHVSDEDADKADYDQMLADLRAAEPERNAARQKAGYPTSHLNGWAQQPTYDRASHSLVWARNFRVAGDPVDSLNYDVRLLGRTGVLSLNMVSDMPHLDQVRSAANSFAKTVSFAPGATYADFDSSVDKDAGYGVAGLVAAGVGVAAAKKLGVLAIVLGFGKKLIFLVVVGFAAIARYAKNLFGGRRKAEPTEETPE